MAKRKVDEALTVMQDSLHEWGTAARKVIRYGNLEDFEELNEQLEFAVELAEDYLAKRMDDSVQRRHQREIDRIYAKGLAKGTLRSEADVVIDDLIRRSQGS